jgi:hypothetical protein
LFGDHFRLFKLISYTASLINQQVNHGWFSAFYSCKIISQHSNNRYHMSKLNHCKTVEAHTLQAALRSLCLLRTAKSAVTSRDDLTSDTSFHDRCSSSILSFKATICYETTAAEISSRIQLLTCLPLLSLFVHKAQTKFIKT